MDTMVSSCQNLTINGLWNEDQNIVLYKGAFDDCRPHNDGVIIRIGDEFYLNKKLLYTGPWDGWCPHPSGVVIRLKDQFILFIPDEEAQLLYQGKFDNWEECPEGVLICVKGTFYVNGRRVYVKKTTNYLPDSKDVILKIKDRIVLNYKRDIYRGDYITWERHPYGIMVVKTDIILLCPI